MELSLPESRADGQGQQLEESYEIFVFELLMLHEDIFGISHYVWKRLALRDTNNLAAMCVFLRHVYPCDVPSTPILPHTNSSLVLPSPLVSVIFRHAMKRSEETPVCVYASNYLRPVSSSHPSRTYALLLSSLHL